MEASDPISMLVQVAGGYCFPRCLHIVADIGVAHALSATLRMSVKLAASVGADADALDRKPFLATDNLVGVRHRIAGRAFTRKNLRNRSRVGEQTRGRRGRGPGRRLAPHRRGGRRLAHHRSPSE